MTITERIIPVFKKNYPLEVRDDVWNYCMSKADQVPINETNLENMCGTDLVTGFGGGGGKEEIIKLAEALGISGISNPEADRVEKSHVSPKTNVDTLTADEILDRIHGSLGFPIEFPKFSGNCKQGLQTKYGVTSNRHIFYLWVMKRILELCPDRSSGIIEIGAGFGVLGYYLDRLGYSDYTTIDLALINSCQTYFLNKNLPERHIIISGDVQNPFDAKWKDSIKLLHSTDFSSVPKDRFRLMVNMDGLTEMGIPEATKYVSSECATMLLSINHEVNPYRVFELSQPHRILKYRYPFWLRDGYVEELYVRRET